MSVAVIATHDDKRPNQQRQAAVAAAAQPATFSFKIPQVPSSSSSGTLKQRRISLALPQAPRVVEGWNFRDDTGLHPQAAETSTSGATKMKKSKSAATAGSSSTPPEGDSNEEAPPKEKKPRKKWTAEETKMLVDGCNKHGVGNWKTILRDPTLKFDNRSPVDLKDRFRTYFPDAYKQHYPNAKTHLSSKVRSMLPDGSSLFEKTRSKRRRPFTEEEDRALKEGYEKYGTVWATIVKDYPIFQEQNRRSTDLRDRFRNAFPDLYQQAGYKPRNSKKKTSVDDQQLTSTGGPVRSRKRVHTHRGGTKSVPQSTVCSEDEYSGDESESPSFSLFKAPPTPPSMKATATAALEKTPSPEKATDDEDEDMDILTLDPLAEALSLPDIGGHNEGGRWSSGVNTPTHSNHWSTAAGSPTSSHLSGDLPVNSPFLPRNPASTNNNFGMIGKSAWGTDWFSPNPRLDPSSSSVGQGSSYFEQSSPASPFSFHHLNYGVVDRYDLFPSTVPNDIASEGAGEAHSSFSDDDDSSLLFQSNRGFTHHSSSAGDLIFGARTHQGYYPSLSSAAVSAIGGSSNGFGFGGLGLNFGGNALAPFQQHQSAGIHPMQLHAHASNMLDGTNEHNSAAGGGKGPDPLGIPLPDAMDEDLEDAASNSVLSDAAQAKHGQLLAVPRAPMRESTTPQPQRHDQQVQASTDDREPHAVSLAVPQPSSAMSVDHQQNQFSLDDFVDLPNDLHSTPPATPLTHPRPMRRSSVSTVQQFAALSDHSNMNGGHSMGPRMGRGEEVGNEGLHARSISVPPSEFRNPLYVPGTTSLDGGYVSALVDFDAMHGIGQQPLDMSVLRHIHPFHSLMATATHQQQGQRQVPQMSPMQGQHRPGANVQGAGARDDAGPVLFDGRGRSGHLGHSKSQGNELEGHDDDDQDEESDLRPQTPTLASRHLLSPSIPSRHLLSATPMSTSLSSSSSSSASSHNSSSSSSSLSSALSLDDSWRPSFLSPNAPSSATSNASLAADIYNLPFLDLHYYGSGNGNGGLMGLNPGAMLSGGDDLSFIDMQAQALDLARSASVTTPSTAVFGSFSGIKATQPQPQQQQQQYGQARQSQHMISSANLIQAFGGPVHGHLSSPVSPVSPMRTTLGQGMGQQPQASPWAMSLAANGGLGNGKSTLGRSQSHHRGQSQHVSATVNPADLAGPISGGEGVRKKRLSWDGMSL